MGDATIQAVIQTLLQADSNFDDDDVTLGDYRKLSAKADGAAVILPGSFRSQRSGDHGQVTYFWTHFVEVWAQFTGDSYSTAVTLRQAVVDVIGENPTLDGTTGVTDCTATAGDRPKFLRKPGQAPTSKPQWVGFDIKIETTEEVNYDGGGEFA